jgi:hypothetical protein
MFPLEPQAPIEAPTKTHTAPDLKPDFVCSDCNLGCFVVEHGYVGTRDDEPIACQKCGKSLGTFDTTGYLHLVWCAVEGIPPKPVSPETVDRFLRSLEFRCLSPKSSVI